MNDKTTAETDASIATDGGRDWPEWDGGDSLAADEGGLADIDIPGFDTEQCTKDGGEVTVDMGAARSGVALSVTYREGDAAEIGSSAVLSPEQAREIARNLQLAADVSEEKAAQFPDDEEGSR